MRSILKVISLQEYHSTMLAFNVSESQPIQNETVSSPGHDLSEFVPKEVLPLRNPQTDIPRIAKDEGLLRLIEGLSNASPRGTNCGWVTLAQWMNSRRRACTWC